MLITHNHNLNPDQLPFLSDGKPLHNPRQIISLPPGQIAMRRSDRQTLDLGTKAGEDGVVVVDALLLPLLLWSVLEIPPSERVGSRPVIMAFWLGRSESERSRVLPNIVQGCGLDVPHRDGGCAGAFRWEFGHHMAGFAAVCDGEE